MRTLSARILLGFIALTVTFVIFTGTMVLNLREVEDQASLILRGYFPLALKSSDLARSQEELKGYLEQGLQEAVRPAQITRTVERLRLSRDQALDEIIYTVGGPRALIDSEGPAASEVARQLPKTMQMIKELKQRNRTIVAMCGAAVVALVAFAAVVV